jgi:hypothetical protein
MNTTEPTTAPPVSGTGEHSAAFAESEACPRNCPTTKSPGSPAPEPSPDHTDGEIAGPSESAVGRSQPSPARLRANRQNAKNSCGPRSEEGKKRSSLNATRHGLLAQTLHLPEEEMAAYHEFTDSFVQGMSPVGPVETQLAHACADLQFRLNRVAAAEHNLFSIGHVEHGDLWSVQVTDSAPPNSEEHAEPSGGAAEARDRCARSSRSPGHPEAHTALAFAETLRRSPDPLKNLSIYEQRLSRRFLQTFKQLREMQAERRALEQAHLEEMATMAATYRANGATRQVIENLDPIDYGFVCSKHSWQLCSRRYYLPTTRKSTRAEAA